MTQSSPVTGVFAIAWAHVEIDGCSGLGPEWLRIGASWRWSGRCLRLDSAPSLLTLQGSAGHARLNSRARHVAARLAGVVDSTAPMDDLHAAPMNGFTLTDGLSLFQARLVRQGTDWLAVFADRLPPQAATCWVTATALPERLRPPPPAQDVICFADDAMIATPQGQRPIALLRPGDTVTTRDNGPQPVLWIGRTTISGMALRQHPHLRPIRLRAHALGAGLPEDDLRVSPAHRILLRGAKAQALFGCDEVLAQARDLIDYKTIAPDIALHGVTYVHLLLDAHQILYANAVPTESFHPALATDHILRQHRSELATLAPEWLAHPPSYGPPARRCLTTAEAALLAA